MIDASSPAPEKPHLWWFKMALSWIKVTEIEVNEFKKNVSARGTVKRLLTASSVVDKMGILTGVIAVSLAASDIGVIARISNEMSLNGSIISRAPQFYYTSAGAGASCKGRGEPRKSYKKKYQL